MNTARSIRQKRLLLFSCGFCIAACASPQSELTNSSSSSTQDVVSSTTETVVSSTTETVVKGSAPSSVTIDATTTTTSTPSGVGQTASLSGIDVLAHIQQVNENGAGYSRELFRHWIDADRDRCTTRQEVLIAESLTPAQVDAFGCAVIAGDWFSAFDGLTHTDPGDLDIDHLVPLKEAWDSGAYAWTAQQREQFANDLDDGRALIAVTNSVNRSKGDKDPSQWLPPRQEYVCAYIADWVAVKKQWGLSMDSSEWARLRNLFSGACRATLIAPWGTIK